MTEKKSNNTKEFIDQKIQYGESYIKCFACGANIDFETKICPYCNTKQESKKKS